MKWKTKHRHEDSSTSSTSSASDALDEPSQVPPTFTSPFLPTVDSLLGRDVSPHSTPKSSPRLGQLLITKDIEALLEEDERVRAQQRQEKQDREAKLGKLDRVALSEDPCSVVRALPPPPRRLPQNRHQKIQSGFQTPMSSGQISGSNFMREGGIGVRRPSMTGGAASSQSVSKRPSIKDVPADLGSARRMSGTEGYAMLDNSSRDETSSVSRLSEFGPKSSRRSPAGTGRESWGATSGFSGTTQPSNSEGPSPSGLADLSGSMALHPSRPLLSQAFFRSRESVYSAASSIDPASTVHEPRISISSTIYPPSTYNELPSPVAAPVGSDQLGTGHRDSLSYTEADSVCVEDDQQHSIVDTSTQTSAECETSVPLRTAFATPEEIYPISSKLLSDTESGPPPRRPLSTSSDVTTRHRSGQKPALPTAPKPDFRRSRSVQPPSKTPMISKPLSRSSSPKLPVLVPYHLLTSFSSSDSNRTDSLPPTTNFLNPQERTDLIRKSRKLTQVFGQTPSPMSGPEELTDSPVLNNCLLPVMPARKVHARAVSDALGAPGIKSSRETHIHLPVGRTGSLSPIRFRSSSSGLGNDSDDSLSPFDSPDAATPLSSRKKNGDAIVRSPTVVSASDSFIDMADHDNPNLIRFPSICSFAESSTDEQRAEEERRRKREKLAKLHRFLGSRVPMELVLGHDLDVPLPPLAPDSKSVDPASDGEVSPATKLWLLAKRRNSLPISDPLERPADSDRLKEVLSDKEKAAAVKRALKMEKMFGEQPPLDLFHSGRMRAGQHYSGVRTMSDSKVPALSAPSSPVAGNINKAAYRKQKLKRNNRPGTSESAKRLLGPGPEMGETDSINDGQSDIYYHYRNSLVSLTNIVDNDDKKSLVELHEYINEDLSVGARDNRESYSNSSTIRSERRRSLPLRASYSSLASQYTISEPKIEATPFEVRRRRAAKLSHFFGVSYRDLFGQVLDSLEMSVREDEGKGTLNADEAKDLLVQLTKLKARRDELS
ncbi:hypothetical protein ACEPAG_472 [Sanghuangporus baumii]